MTVKLLHQVFRAVPCHCGSCFWVTALHLCGLYCRCFGDSCCHSNYIVTTAFVESNRAVPTDLWVGVSLDSLPTRKALRFPNNQLSSICLHGVIAQKEGSASWGLQNSVVEDCVFCNMTSISQGAWFLMFWRNVVSSNGYVGCVCDVSLYWMSLMCVTE